MKKGFFHQSWHCNLFFQLLVEDIVSFWPCCLQMITQKVYSLPENLNQLWNLNISTVPGLILIVFSFASSGVTKVLGIQVWINYSKSCCSVSQMTQFAGQVNTTLISQLICGISSILQKLLRYSNGIATSTFTVSSVSVLFTNLDLNLNDLDSVMLSFRSSQQYC